MGALLLLLLTAATGVALWRHATDALVFCGWCWLITVLFAGLMLYHREGPFRRRPGR